MVLDTTAVVIPNWNGADLLKPCIDSLLRQTVAPLIIVVENGSQDESDEILRSYEKKIVVLRQKINLGFAGGVNVGIRYALDRGIPFIALLNNDAVAEPDWIESLLQDMKSEQVGIVTSKILIADSNVIDSTGDFYTTTGMPFPRGRGEIDTGQYDGKKEVFGGSGGASLYRSKMLETIGLFDEDFFAYYEDVDLSFRAQLAGWKAIYQPEAVVHHQLSATSSKHGYFAVRQSAKNFWWLYIKNLPAPLLLRFLPAALYRFLRMFAARFIKGGAWSFFTGFLRSLVLFPRKIQERRKIQSLKKVEYTYILNILYHGKPPVPGRTGNKRGIESK